MHRTSRVLFASLSFALFACGSSGNSNNPSGDLSSSGGGSSPGQTGSGTLTTGPGGVGQYNGSPPTGKALLPAGAIPSGLQNEDILQITSDGTTVFIAALSGIYAVPKAGGTVTAISGNLPTTANPVILGVGSSTVTVAAGAEAADAGFDQMQLYTLQKAGGNPTAGPVLPTDGMGPAADANNVYYEQLHRPDAGSDAGNTWTLDMMPLAGGPATSLTPTSDIATFLLADNGFVYYTDRDRLADGGVELPIFRVPVGGGPTMPLNVQGAVMATDATKVYFDDGPSGTLSVAKDGSNAPAVVTPFTQTGLSLQSGVIYGFTEAFTSSPPTISWVVDKVPSSGGNVTVLGAVPSTSTPTAFGADDSNAYIAVTGPQIYAFAH
jgi:hypothetical protein